MNQLECRPTIEVETFRRAKKPSEGGKIRIHPVRRLTPLKRGILRSRQLELSVAVAIMFIIIGLASCRSPDISRETHIRDTTYTIVPPAIIDSGRMERRVLPLNPPPKGDSVFIPAPRDTVYQYARISGGDTTVRITFVPRTRWVYYKVKPDTIYYTARDTLTKYETREKIIETPWMAKVGIYSYGVITVLIIGLVIYLINWYKYGRVKPATIEAKSDDGLP